jgi:hypothetical protein
VQHDPSSDHEGTGSLADDEVRRAAHFLDGLMKAVGDKRLSYAALGIFVRLADDDSQQMTVHALAAERCPNDERQVLDALGELQLAGYVRLEDAQADDQPQTTTAHLIHA